MTGKEYRYKYLLLAVGFSALTALPSDALAGDPVTIPGVIGGVLTVPNNIIDIKNAGTLNVTTPYFPPSGKTPQPTVAIITGNINTPINIGKLTTSGFVAPSSITGNIVSATTQTMNTKLGKLTSIDLMGDGMTQIAVSKESVKLLGKHSGGQTPSPVSLTTRQTEKLLDNVVNMKGFSQATSVGLRNGVIVLGETSAISKNVKNPKTETKSVETVNADQSPSLIQKIENNLSNFFDDGQASIDQRHAYDKEESRIILGK